ncbi:glycosyltransferase [Marinomonas dokdonensis]|uniref:glycosyltransferase n=1 Tax=Marinomonas dokdonensis TaxID=328224 RepID=UPI00405583EB
MDAKKIAVVSNYSEKCGIAQYTENLLNGFNRHDPSIAVDVLQIDSHLMKSKRKIHRKRKVDHIKEIAAKLKQYDAVNIQFENGIFGSNNLEVLRHINILVSSTDNVTITMHTVDYGSENDINSVDIIKLALKFKFKAAFGGVYRVLRSGFLDQFMKLIKKTSGVKLIVHTKREQKNLSSYYDFNQVYVHPLAFTDKEERESLPLRDHVLKGYGISDDDVCISIFGFISKYKGHLTALKALSLLPDNYKILIVGSQHPASVKKMKEIDGYIESVIKLIKTNELVDRVVFAGNVTDERLKDIMKLSDVSIFPYLEVGQSASGPASMQLEFGGRAIYSNAHVFSELNKFCGNEMVMCDIGNYVELSGLIERLMLEDDLKDNTFNKNHSLKTNVLFYKKVLLGDGQ